MKNIDFIKSFHGNSKMWFRIINNTSINIHGTFEEKYEELKSKNEQGFDIYFVVNSGGTHSNEINKINAVFVDFDAGRDENKKYFPIEKVKSYKKQKWEIIHDFKFKPTFIVETRNGHHVYWLTENTATPEQFIECQSRLINFFQSDPAVKTQERIMRVPDFWWTKSGYERFMSKVVENNDLKYNIQEIIDSLPEIKKVEKNRPVKISYKKNDNVFFLKFSDNKDKEDNTRLIRKLDVIGMREKLYGEIKHNRELGGDNTSVTLVFSPPQTPTIFKDKDEMLDYIKKIDLMEFLGVYKNNIKCFFHDDSNPSAGISKNETTGHWIFTCQSSNCKFNSNTIIGVVKELAHCSKIEAIKFIQNVYNIEFKNEWLIKQKNILNSNIEFLLGNEMRDNYPNLHKILQNKVKRLITIHEIAIEHLDDKKTTINGNPIFFMSLSYLAQKVEISNLDTISKDIGLFTYFYLIEKLDNKSIPKDMLDTANWHAKKKARGLGKERFKYHISFYSIPQFNEDLLCQTEKLAIDFRDKNITIKGFSRELLFRTFGKDVAERVYPQCGNQPPSAISDEWAQRFDRVLLNLIDQHGYATECQILDFIPGNKEHNKEKLKRVLPETLDKYLLKRIRTSKSLKEYYGIDSKGYPFIIYREDILELDKTIGNGQDSNQHKIAG